MYTCLLSPAQEKVGLLLPPPSHSLRYEATNNSLKTQGICAIGVFEAEVVVRHNGGTTKAIWGENHYFHLPFTYLYLANAR